MKRIIRERRLYAEEGRALQTTGQVADELARLIDRHHETRGRPQSVAGLAEAN